MKINYLFPDTILIEQVNEQDFKAIGEEIEYNFEIINRLLNCGTWNDKIHTTYEKCICIITELNLNKLKSILNPLIYNYAKTLNIKSINSENITLKRSWISIATPGGFQDLHVHNHNVISGCIYLNILPDSGNIEFQPPTYQLYKGASVYKPKNGMILIFHGLMPHRTFYNRSNKNRISL